MSKLPKKEKVDFAVKSARDKLISFALAVNPRYEVNWHHRLIAKKLQEAYEAVKNGEKYRLILELPPRHGKSLLSTIIFPAWVLGQSPEMPIMVASYSGDLASDFGLQTRDLMENEFYEYAFGTELRPDTKAKAKWMTKSGGGYTAAGVGGAITGKGFKIGIIDDPFKNREEAESDTIRDKVWNWYTSTFYTRQDGVGAIIVIMTRWHLDDLVGRLLSKQEEDEKKGITATEKWERVRFPAIAEKDEKYRTKGEALWPDRFGKDVLREIKNSVGVYDWQALYQQSPIASETQEFKNQYFRYRSFKEVREKNTRNFLTVDTAYSRRDYADYVALVSNFVDSEGNWNIAVLRQRMSPQELIDNIYGLHAQNAYTKIGIEETGYTVGLAPFMQEEQKRRGVYLPIEPIKHASRNKEVRIRGLLPRYQGGRIFHIVGECDALEKEALSFPFGKHDDALDALAYQLDLASAPPHRAKLSKEDKFFAKILAKKERKRRKGSAYNLKMTR